MALLDKHSGMSRILVQGEESTLGKAIYLAAERKNVGAVRIMLASFISFKSKRDIVYDKAKGYIPMIIQPICAAFGLGAVGKVVENIFTSELSERYEAIRFIDEVYREGEWALDVEIVPVEDLLRYYKRAAKNFKEMNRREFEDKLAKAQLEGAAGRNRFLKRLEGIKGGTRRVKHAINKELERDKGSMLHALMDEVDVSILSVQAREAYLAERDQLRESALASLEQYVENHGEYEAFIKENISPIIKRAKRWDAELGPRLKELYLSIIKKRRELRDKIYDYAEYSSHGYRMAGVSAANASLAV